MQLVYDSFLKQLKDRGAEPFDSVGQKLDTERMEAIAHLPSPDVEEGLVSIESKRGWILLFSVTLIPNCKSLRGRRQWQPTPVLLPGESHGQKSLVGCSPWGCEEWDTTKRLHFHFHALEKEMATHSSVLAWRIPGTGEPGRLPSMGSHRVGAKTRGFHTQLDEGPETP